MKKLLLTTLALGVAASGSLGQTAPFTRITAGPIPNELGGFPSATWADFHGTGFLDLFVCKLGINGFNGYFRNNGDGTFTKITQGDGVIDTAAHIGPAVADYDNDGYPDLLISQSGWQMQSGTAPQVLYHNNGDGSFTLAAGSGVTNTTGYYWWSSAVDYDNDGFVDFFVPGGNGHGGVLFHNNRDGTFGLAASVLNSLTDNQNVSWADYDGDGFMDCLISGNTRNFLYHNNRNGTFTRVTTNSVAQDNWASNPYGSAWGDYDNCGLLDLFVTGVESTNRLYHNLGNGVFTNITSGPMLRPPPGGAWNACAYDNDGYLDLFVSGYGATNALFHNNGDGTFTQVLSGPPIERGNTNDFCNSCGWADYDNDGFLDLLVTRGNSDAPAPTAVANWLYHNNGNSNAWLKVKLVGTVANRSAIGAKVRVHATIGGKTFWQLREIESSGGRTIQGLVAHFGLGDATNVDTLRIEWPSGTVQELHDVAARQILTITEPPRLMAAAANGLPQFTLKAWPGMQFEVQASDDLITWAPLGTVTVTNLNGLVSITDTNAPAGRRFYQAKQQ